jgi:hypothetical protein
MTPARSDATPTGQASQRAFGLRPLDVDAHSLSEAIASREPVALRHNLCHEPLLTRSAIADLAESLPAEQIEHHLAELPLILPSGEAAQLPTRPRDIVEGIAGNGCWMVLWHVERSATYASLVARALVDMRAALPRTEGRLQPTEGLLLVASPTATVPAHVDNHHNVLFQIEGTKEVMVGAYDDPALQQRQVEWRYGPARRNVDRMPDRAARFALGPGDALYIPPYAVHWVIGGDDVSVSLSCNFATEATERDQRVHECNARLRRLHIAPAPPGRSILRDRAKVAVLHSWLRVRSLPRAARRHASRLAPRRA